MTKPGRRRQNENRQGRTGQNAFAFLLPLTSRLSPPLSRHSHVASRFYLYSAQAGRATVAFGGVFAQATLEYADDPLPLKDRTR